MPRKERPTKTGPRSGRVSPTASIGAQSNFQIIRVYNTSGDVEFPLTLGYSVPESYNVSKACSLDFVMRGNNTMVATLGNAANQSEGIYESVPTVGLRSGRFKKPGTDNRTIIRVAASTVDRPIIYRFFNTHKGSNLSLSINSNTATHVIKSRSSSDILIPMVATVKVGTNDEGVYDFLTFDLEGAVVDAQVRSGHFEDNAVIADMTANLSSRPAVYRVINAGSRTIQCTSGTQSITIAKESSCDIEVAAGMKLEVAETGTGSAKIEGSYELLKIN